jgi:hypothetical protein
MHIQLKLYLPIEGVEQNKHLLQTHCFIHPFYLLILKVKSHFSKLKLVGLSLKISSFVTLIFKAWSGSLEIPRKLVIGRLIKWLVSTGNNYTNKLLS